MKCIKSQQGAAANAFGCCYFYWKNGKGVQHFYDESMSSFSLAG
jgi:hypothetical protein